MINKEKFVVACVMLGACGAITSMCSMLSLNVDVFIGGILSFFIFMMLAAVVAEY